MQGDLAICIDFLQRCVLNVFRSENMSLRPLNHERHAYPSPSRIDGDFALLRKIACVLWICTAGGTQKEREKLQEARRMCNRFSPDMSCEDFRLENMSLRPLNYSTQARPRRQRQRGVEIAMSYKVRPCRVRPVGGFPQCPLLATITLGLLRWASCHLSVRLKAFL